MIDTVSHATQLFQNHLLLEDEPAWEVFLSEVREFLGVTSPALVATSPLEGNSGHPDGLTPREIEVLRLIASGKSNQDIADEPFITQNTAANHVKNILGKTESANRTEAAAYAIVRGLTSAEV